MLSINDLSSSSFPPTPIIEKHQGIYVVRDDYLVGGTKSIVLDSFLDKTMNEYVYASPVYGGFQIALSAYCQQHGKKATIVCAQRKKLHPNTIQCIQLGANIIQVPYGYLTVIEKYAREYCLQNQKEKGNTWFIQKIVFGANSPENHLLIAHRMKQVLQQLEKEPNEIWCAVGSGTLLQGILQAVPNHIEVKGVQVGSFISNHLLSLYSNLTLIPYPKSFEYESKYTCPFPSMPNYDLKAWEICCCEYQKKTFQENKIVLFWNVL